MIKLLSRLLSANRKNKRLISISYDSFAIVFSIYLATALRLDDFTFEIGLDETASALCTVIVTIFCFIRLGMYRAVLRYMMLPALGNIFIAVVISSVTLALSSFFFQSFVPRSVPFIYCGFAILALGGPRVLFRTIYYHYYRRKKPNVFIYGAGATGRDLAYALVQGNEYHPVVLLDDDANKAGQVMFGIKVHHAEDFESLMSLYQPVKLLLAINNINKGERLRLLEKLSNWPIAVQSVPSVEDIAAGRAQATDVKDLDVADLLGRSPVEPDINLMEKNILGKNVMVTGAGGSIGSELCRQIAVYKPKTLVLFELNEYNLYSIDQELQLLKEKQSLDIKIVASLGSVQKENRLLKNYASA